MGPASGRAFRFGGHAASVAPTRRRVYGPHWALNDAVEHRKDDWRQEVHLS
jgi:hypothetical protein